MLTSLIHLIHPFAAGDGLSMMDTNCKLGDAVLTSPTRHRRVGLLFHLSTLICLMCFSLIIHSFEGAYISPSNANE